MTTLTSAISPTRIPKTWSFPELPNAAFIGFTGTPLIAGEELTKEVFGDYISIYNFKQSIDAATRFPSYENRIPELQITNENLTSDIAKIIEDAELDEDQEEKLKREFAREYHLITREERLDKIAEDRVAHYTGRGVLAKAIVISIDKATTVRMYDRVQKYWKSALDRLNLVEIEVALTRHKKRVYRKKKEE